MTRPARQAYPAVCAVWLLRVRVQERARDVGRRESVEAIVRLSCCALQEAGAEQERYGRRDAHREVQLCSLHASDRRSGRRRKVARVWCQQSIGAAVMKRAGPRESRNIQSGKRQAGPEHDAEARRFDNARRSCLLAAIAMTSTGVGLRCVATLGTSSMFQPFLASHMGLGRLAAIQPI